MASTPTLCEESLNTPPCPHTPHNNMQTNSLLIDGCGCAVTGVTPDGAIIYEWDLLLTHFAEHEFKDASEDADERLDMAAEWLDYNVVRGLMYVGGDAILPVIKDGYEVIFPEDEDEDCDF